MQELYRQSVEHWLDNRKRESSPIPYWLFSANFIRGDQILDTCGYYISHLRYTVMRKQAEAVSRERRMQFGGF